MGVLMTGLRLIFMGTPEFAVPSLDGLLAAGHDVALVCSQPDRPAGRGRKLAAPPIAQLARERGLPLFQPPSLKPPEAFARLREVGADAIVVAAYGLILRREVIELPPLGCLNVHASLLPRHRGAAPISAAILAGDGETGVCIMRMDVGLDTGPAIARAATPIGPGDDTPRLTERLAELGRDLLIETLPRWADGGLTAEPQDESLATYAPRIVREDARLDWSLPAEELSRRVRAYRGWPDAFTSWQGRQLKVLAARPVAATLERAASGSGTREPAASGALSAAPVAPGTMVLLSGEHPPYPAVATGNGLLALETVALEGKRPTAAVDFARGYRDIVGARLGT